MTATQTYRRCAQMRLLAGRRALCEGRFADARRHLAALHFWLACYRQQLIAETGRPA